MDEQKLPGRDDESEIFKRFASHYDAPAFMRRAQRVHDAYDQLLARCRKQREEWIPLVRSRLGMLQALAEGWERLLFCLADAAQLQVLERLVEVVAPRVRVAILPTESERALRKALVDLSQSIARFNRRWEEFVPSLDLSPVNAEREGYNRYYLLEKECAVRSATVARQGFRRLDLLTHADLFAVFPLLSGPRMKD